MAVNIHVALMIKDQVPTFLFLYHHHNPLNPAIMGVFDSRPFRRTGINKIVAKYPGAYGVPFILLMVLASYGLSSFTQIRYDLHDKKQQKLTKEQELGLSNPERRRKFDIREEYYVRLAP
jgi:cytochrome c oxidase assembly protein subunit 16